MSKRLIPAYVENPAWAVYDAFANLDTSDPDPDDLDALTYAPAYVLAQIFNRR